MGGNVSTASINCPKTVQYINEKKEERSKLENTQKQLEYKLEKLTNTINDKIKEKKAIIDSNNKLQDEINKKFTKNQLDDFVKLATEPLKRQIESNNITIDNLNKQINDLIKEKQNLTKQFELENNLLEQSLNLSNIEIKSTNNLITNKISDTNQKMYDYYIGIKEQNDKFFNILNNNKSENLTYDQKAFYQMELYNYILNFNNILFIIYYVFIIVLIGIIFFVQKEMSIIYKSIIIILLIIYPFLIDIIEKTIYNAMKDTYMMINKNVYSYE